MKISFDDQIFTWQVRGGVSRYFVELMSAFRKDSSFGINVSPGSFWTKNEHLLDAGMGHKLRMPMGERGRILSYANRLSPHQRGDVLHHTYYDPRYLNRGRGSSFRVVTVHDMIPELLPEYFASGNPHLAKRKFVECADLILCVSAATARDLLDVYGRVDAPVRVVPHGVGSPFGPSSTKPELLPDQYVIFVGQRGGYKDFIVLAEAVALLRDEARVSLLAVGGGPFKQAELDYLERLGIAKQVHQRTLTDRELAGAYANALCFVFPSRYEGFGLPTLEAMASGCATILANSSSHPEVGGEVALYFPPGDTVVLAQRLRELILDEGLQASRRVESLERAKQFGWRNTATATAAAYRELIAGELT